MTRNLSAFFRLIRYKNLFIVALTQYLMRFAIMEPILGINDFDLQLGEFQFFLLVLATMLITAAGYVINDYFDTRTDMLNRPDTVIIGRQISRRTAIIMHWVLNFTGILIGFYLAFHIGIPMLGISFVIVGGLLWFYSTTYNRQFLIGNLVVAFLTAMVPLMVVLFEIPLLNREYGEIMMINQASFSYIFAWVGSFGYFAFITTLARELIKDIEDYEGDMEQGRRSVPIVLGIPYTKLIIGGLIILTLISLAYLYKAYLMIGFYGETDYLSLLYFIVFLLLPLSMLFYRVVKAQTREEYRSANKLAKFIMLTGLMYSLLVRYIILTSF
ncbi:MAG: geranylgeranylglycerol-phosphate geranylgeranyltransferase [Bacteroidales bacterium]